MNRHTDVSHHNTFFIDVNAIIAIPIRLLTSFSHLLYNYLNIHDIITSCQYGFRRHHSTELAAIELVDRTTSELDHYKIPFNIYIDMSKAFDLIDFTVLLHKLSHYGIHDTALKLLKSYLTDKKTILLL